MQFVSKSPIGGTRPEKTEASGYSVAQRAQVALEAQRVDVRIRAEALERRRRALQSEPKMLVLRVMRAVAAPTLGSMGLGTAALAQEFPNRPVRFVVAAGPGGSTDNLARLRGERVAQWQQPVVYDKRPGAGGLIAGEVAAKASPDGHTMLLSTRAAIAVSVSLYQKMSYDPVKDFARKAYASLIRSAVLKAQ